MKPVNDEERRKALGGFLKTRRARMSPDEVGLPNGSRRRAPGLRREEVASLASVSITWYTWLEQGRDIRVSEQVLESIATALRFRPDERNHLFRLAHKRVPNGQPPVTEKVSPVLQNVLDSLGTSPAWIIDHRWNILAWNRAATTVFADFGDIPAEERNILRFTFTDGALRRRLVDWEAFARGMMATFRASSGKQVAEAWFVEFIKELETDCREFREWWVQHDVRGAPVERIEVDHPEVGRLDLNNTSFQVNSDPGMRVCVYTASPDSETAEKIQELVGSPVARA